MDTSWRLVITRSVPGRCRMPSTFQTVLSGRNQRITRLIIVFLMCVVKPKTKPAYSCVVCLRLTWTQSVNRVVSNWLGRQQEPSRQCRTHTGL